MGVLSRPFLVIYDVLRVKKYKNKINTHFVFVLFLVLLVAFGCAFFIVARFNNEISIPNLVVKTVIKLFYSFCLFSPFCDFYAYIRVGVKRNNIKITVFFAYILLCLIAVFINDNLKW